MTARVLLLWLSAAACLAACTNTLDPFSDEGGSFAVYGVLDTARDTQVVRIEPVVPTTPFDVTRIGVVLRDETDGAAFAFEGAVVRLDDGTEGLVYRVPVRVQSGHAYTVAVALDGAVQTRARTTIPARRAARVEAPEEPDATGTYTFLPVVLAGPLSPPARFEAVYTIETRADAQGRTTDSLRSAVPYTDGASATGGYRYRLNLASDRALLRHLARRASSDTLRLLSLSMRVRQDAPARTGQVEGGAGALAAVGVTTEGLALPDSLVRQMGFAPRR